MDKFNLILNKIFNKYEFEYINDFSIYNTINDTLLSYLCFVNISPKTSDVSATTTVNLNDTVNCYITPLFIENFNLSKGDIIQFPDNNTIYVIEAIVNENLFTLRLINTTGATHTIKNNDLCFIYNNKIFTLLNKYNNITEILKSARNNFTEFLNNENLQTFVENNINLITTNTDCTVIVTTNTQNYIDNILNKFYININIFDYNSFKYIYMNDIASNISSNNKNMSSNKQISGILKFETLKLLPDYSSKILIGNNISYTTNTINKNTTYQKSYDNDKLIILFQFTLKNKMYILDRFDNIESDYIFLIY